MEVVIRTPRINAYKSKINCKHVHLFCVNCIFCFETHFFCFENIELQHNFYMRSAYVEIDLGHFKSMTQEFSTFNGWSAINYNNNELL
jgi:hypothetical protein